MIVVIKSLVSLFAATSLLMLGNGVLSTALSIRLELEQVSETTIGLVMAAYSIGIIVGTRYGHRIIRRIGHIRAFAVFAALSTCAVLVHAMWIHPFVWFVLRVLTGMALTGLYMVIESWLNESADSNIRGRVFSIYQICSFLGLAISQLLLLYLTPMNFELFVLLAIFFALALIPVCFMEREHPKEITFQSYGIAQLYRDAPLAVVGCIGAGLVNNVFYTLSPIFVVQNGLQIDQVAVFMGFTIFSGFLWQWPIGVLSDRYDRGKLLYILYVCVGVFSLLMILVFWSGSTFWLWPVCLLNGLMFTLYAVCVAHANDHVEPKDITQVAATLLMSYGVGAFTGPIVASALMNSIGSSALYGFSATVSAVLAIMIYIIHKSHITRVEEQEPFIATPRTSPVIAELDPRGEEH